MFVGRFTVTRTEFFHSRYEQLVGVRVCLGFAEAGLFPGVIY